MRARPVAGKAIAMRQAWQHALSGESMFDVLSRCQPLDSPVHKLLRDPTVDVAQEENHPFARKIKPEPHLHKRCRGTH